LTLASLFYLFGAGFLSILPALPTLEFMEVLVMSSLDLGVYPVSASSQEATMVFISLF